MPTPAHDTAAAAVPIRRRSLIRLEGATVRFGGLRPLDGVSLSLGAGERVALVGPNGSGKSTLLRVLHGLQRLSAGQLELEPGLRTAMVFQRPAMLRLPLWAHVALAPWLAGCPWREARAQALSMLDRVGLGAHARQNARTLSGGQQQRAAMARAWALQPQVMLLDEPTASLDPQAKLEVESLIAGLGDQGVTLVMASHNLGQVKRLATRVLYLEQGRLLADLPVERLFGDASLAHTHPQVHLFIKGETT